MATIILGAVGRAIGGPLGGIAGSLVGGFVDRAVFGGSARDVGRLGNPVVQSSAYGEAIPIVYGRMRVAGNVIWSSGIAEQVDSGGGGKGGPATNQYRYFSSFAVSLAARMVVGIGRIWADGRMIRDAYGVWSLPVQMRLHQGSERQLPDPLVSAAEGAGLAPAYRGLAYAVFEDLPLADFGNRIPNLSFELIADDDAPLDFAGASRALAAQTGEGGVSLGSVGSFPVLSGFVAARTGSLGSNLAPIVEALRVSVTDDVGELRLERAAGGAAVVPSLAISNVDAVIDCQARSVSTGDGLDGRSVTDRQTLAGGQQLDSLEIGHYATDRDYLAGLQRVRRSAGNRVAQIVLPAAMEAGRAKALAAELLVQRRAGRLTRVLRLPWRFIGLTPGMFLQVSDSPALWLVKEQTFEGFVVSLSVERVGIASAGDLAGDPGRPQVFDDAPPGPTTLVAVELPSLGGLALMSPRVQLFAAGERAQWRRAAIELSQDAGESYQLAGVVNAPCVMGQLAADMRAGTTARWDEHSTVEVELLSETMWLESASPASVLQGANLAMVGEELFQFAEAEPIAARRFRLRKLLRGRYGTEAAAGGHDAGQPFLLVRPTSSLPLDLPLDAIGRALTFRAAGTGDDGTSVISLNVAGRALRPLSPAHLRLRREGADVRAQWIRRSRAGFAWLDFADAPLGEESERYEVVVRLDGVERRRVEQAGDVFVYSAADRAADGGGNVFEISVAQISATVGPGDVSIATMTLA